jgi:hypothetical protein
VETPVSTDYRGYQIYKNPSASQGPTEPMALNLLESSGCQFRVACDPLAIGGQRQFELPTSHRTIYRPARPPARLDQHCMS